MFGVVEELAVASRPDRGPFDNEFRIWTQHSSASTRIYQYRVQGMQVYMVLTLLSVGSLSDLGEAGFDLTQYLEESDWRDPIRSLTHVIIEISHGGDQVLVHIASTRELPQSGMKFGNSTKYLYRSVHVASISHAEGGHSG